MYASGEFDEEYRCRSVGRIKGGHDYKYYRNQTLFRQVIEYCTEGHGRLVGLSEITDVERTGKTKSRGGHTDLKEEKDGQETD